MLPHKAERPLKLATSEMTDNRKRHKVQDYNPQTIEQSRQFDRPMSNEMAALSCEDTMPQSLADAHCSSAAQ